MDTTEENKLLIDSKIKTFTEFMDDIRTIGIHLIKEGIDNDDLVIPIVEELYCDGILKIKNQEGEVVTYDMYEILRSYNPEETDR